MNKRRPSDTCEQAISYAIGVMGAPAMGVAIGRTAGLIYKASDPDNDHELRWPQAIEIDKAWKAGGFEGAPPMLAHHMAALDHSDEAPAGNFRDADSELLDMFPALARLQEVVRRNKSDRHWSESDNFEAAKARAEVFREIDEAIAAAKHECSGPNLKAAE